MTYRVYIEVRYDGDLNFERIYDGEDINAALRAESSAKEQLGSAFYGSYWYGKDEQCEVTDSWFEINWGV